MHADRRQKFAGILLFVTPLLFSTNFIGARVAVGLIEPHQLAFWRWLTALAITLPLAWPSLRAAWPGWRREWPVTLLLGGLGMWICGAFVYIGARTSPAINIGLIYTLSPVLIAVLSVRLLGERLRGTQLAGAALALGGVGIILFKGSLANVLAVRLTIGDLWIAVAAVAWAAYSVIQRRHPSRLDDFARQTLVTAGGVLVLLPFTAAEIAVSGAAPLSAPVVGLVLAVALIPGLCAYQSYAYVQRVLGAARAGLTLYLAPLYGALLGWALLGEQPEWFHAVGAAMLLPGIWLATRRG